MLAALQSEIHNLKMLSTVIPKKLDIEDPFPMKSLKT